MGSYPRVAFFNQTALYGGAERSLFDIVKNYPGPCTVFLMQSGPLQTDLVSAGIETVVLRTSIPLTRYARGLRTIFSLAAIVYAIWIFSRAAKDYDIVYANSMKAAVVAALSRPLHRRKIIWHLRSLLTKDHFSRLMLASVRGISNRWIDLVIANSKATAAAFQDNGGRQSPVVIYNGFDTSKFHPNRRHEFREALVARTGLAPDRPILGMLGRIASWKGQEVVLKAISLEPDWQLLIVGAAIFESEGDQHFLAETLRTRQKKSRIHFLGHCDNVEEVIGGFDLAIHASILPEPFGRVVVEAMMAGTPIIASNAGGVPEIVTDGLTGRLVQPGSPAQLHAAICAALQDRTETQAMATRARLSAHTHFPLTCSLPAIYSAITATAH